VTEAEENAALLRAVLALLLQLHRKMDKIIMSQSQLDTDIAALQAAVERDTTVEQSAITLLNGIPGMISTAIQQALAAGATQQQLQAVEALASSLQSNADALAQAVAANTPASSGSTGTPSGAAPQSSRRP
jgi:hypothetical protein